MPFDFDLKCCRACPRECGAERTVSAGFCGIGDKIRLAKVMAHFWEEPCISGKNGSGAVFFSGCSLGCLFCQNRVISSGLRGTDISAERFEEIILGLQEKGVHNINLVTASHQLSLIYSSLEKLRPKLNIPIVWNCGGYEKAGIIGALGKIVDIWLPDVKFFSPGLADKYCSAPDYPEIAFDAVGKMLELTGKTVIEDGLMKRGVIVRHLVVPGSRKDSEAVLRELAARFGTEGYLLSLMAQYTPNGVEGTPDRRITTYEYESVKEVALSLGFDGYFQEKSSAKEEYTPEFDMEGV